MKKESVCKVIYDQYDYVVHLVKRMGVAESDVADLAGEVILSAVRARSVPKSPDKVKAWLKVIATNKVKKHFVRKNRLKEISNYVLLDTGEEVDIFDILADEMTVEKMFQDAEDAKLVRCALRTLGETEQAVITMRFVNEYKFCEIAEILAKNENTVKSIYRRSLVKLGKNYRILNGEEL